MPDQVTQYIEGAPAEMQDALIELRSMIENALPDATVVLPNRFPVYTIDDSWIAGFAWRKKGPMFYLMRHDVLDRYRDQLGRLASGKSCVEYRGSRFVPFAEVRETVQMMLNEVARSAART